VLHDTLNPKPLTQALPKSELATPVKAAAVMAKILANIQEIACPHTNIEYLERR
jgi:hypothetical protein